MEQYDTIMKKLLSTKEIEKHIKQEISRSEYASLLLKKLELTYHFTNTFDLPGTYIFSDEEGYHCVGIGDKGKKYPDKRPKTLEEVSWFVYQFVARNVSMEIANIGVGDFRQYIFKKEIEILASINEKYALLGEGEIEKTLAIAPLDHSFSVEEIDQREKAYNDRRDINKPRVKTSLYNKFFGK